MRRQPSALLSAGAAAPSRAPWDDRRTRRLPRLRDRGTAWKTPLPLWSERATATAPRPSPDGGLRSAACRASGGDQRDARVHVGHRGRDLERALAGGEAHVVVEIGRPEVARALRRAEAVAAALEAARDRLGGVRGV